MSGIGMGHRRHGLACPGCGEQDAWRVIDSRMQQGYLRRRRVCACGHRMTTHELPADEVARLRRSDAALRGVVDVVVAAIPT